MYHPLKFPKGACVELLAAKSLGACRITAAVRLFISRTTPSQFESLDRVWHTGSSGDEGLVALREARRNNSLCRLAYVARKYSWKCGKAFKDCDPIALHLDTWFHSRYQAWTTMQ